MIGVYNSELHDPVLMCLANIVHSHKVEIQDSAKQSKLLNAWRKVLFSFLFIYLFIIIFILFLGFIYLFFHLILIIFFFISFFLWDFIFDSVFCRSQTFLVKSKSRKTFFVYCKEK